MLLTGIEHVQIAAPAGCEHQARDFFGRLLGLEEIEKPEALRSRGGCWFRIGSQQLHVGVEENFRPAVKAHPAFAVTEIDRLAETLSNAGLQCRWDESIPGVRRFHAHDPWGNRLEFVETQVI